MRGSLLLCQLARCIPTAEARLLRLIGRSAFPRPPSHYLQVASDRAAKDALLESYGSIDPAKHRRSYWMANSAVEGLYLFGDDALAAMQRVLQCLETVEVDDMFPSALSWKNIAGTWRAWRSTKS
jgi:hypothetical protein